MSSLLLLLLLLQDPASRIAVTSEGNLIGVSPENSCTIERLLKALKLAHEEFVPEVKSSEDVEIRRNPSTGQYYVVHPRSYYLNDNKQHWTGETLFKGVPLGVTSSKLRRDAEELTRQAEALDRKLQAVQEIAETIRLCESRQKSPNE